MATIRFFAAAKAATGQSSYQSTVESVDAAIREMQEQFPEIKKVLTKCSYLLNEVACHDLNTKLTEQDVLDVLPPFAGG